MTETLTKKLITDGDRWEAVCQNKPDATFFYAVKTTGIYCLPTCSSRLPKPENILYYSTWLEAEASGFRACKRCQPKGISLNERQNQVIVNICKLISEAEGTLSLKELAKVANLSPDHFQRVFKQIVGMSPKEYVQASRAQKVRDRLQNGTSITETIYEAGFTSSSRFYDRSSKMLGMTPTEYKKGAKGREIRYATSESYLGWVLLAATETGICAIEFGENPEALEAQIHRQFPQAKSFENDLTFKLWLTQLIAFIELPERGFNLPLDIQGTVFQQQVWQALQAIPIGSTLSCSELANKIGNPKAVRACSSCLCLQ